MLKTGKFDGVSIISQQSNDGIWKYMQIYLLAYIFPKSKQCALGMPTMAALGFLSLSLSLTLYFQHLTEAQNSSIPLCS